MALEEHTKTKDRSPNFPFISLQAALRRATEFYAEEKRSAAPFAVAAKNWNYSPNSSGALQTASALKSYGLMVDEAAGAQRKLKLTDLALRILLDVRPDSVERAEFIRQAALKPSVAAEIHKKWPGDLPSDANLHHYLVFDRKFNESFAQKAVKIIKENQLLSRAGRSVNVSPSEDCNKDPFDGAIKMDMGQHVIGMTPTAIRSPTPPTQADVQVIPIPGGKQVKIQFSEAPTEADYRALKKCADFQIELLTE